MKLTYSSLKDEDIFILTDFSCDQSIDLLNRKDLFKILWSQQTSPPITIDDYQISLKENEIIFCTPLNVIDLPINSEGLLSFVFNKEFFCIQTHDEQVSCNGFLFFGSSQPQTVILSEEESTSFNRIVEMFKEDLLIKDHLQGEMLRSLLKRLLIQSTRMAKKHLPEPSLNNSQMDIIRAYNILVEKHFREYHHVKDYANLLYKSPKTLANLFPKYSDESPLMVINNRILLEAKRLLLYSEHSTSEIAEQLGYKDPGHFSKFFKKHQGLSPSAYRKKKLIDSKIA